MNDDATATNPKNGPGPQPLPEWIRGRCPQCGADLVSGWEYVEGRGYLIYWACWNALSDAPSCDYQKVL